MEKIKITVCVPTYNRGYVLGRCLDSLVRQTFSSFEVIVVDDGSVDDTSKVCEKYKDKLNMQYFYKSNGGKHTALNLGIEQANGDFLLYLILMML